MSEPLQQWQCDMDPQSQVSTKPGSAGRVWVLFKYAPTAGVTVLLSNDDALAFGAAVILAARDAEMAKEARAAYLLDGKPVSADELVAAAVHVFDDGSATYSPGDAVEILRDAGHEVTEREEATDGQPTETEG